MSTVVSNAVDRGDFCPRCLREGFVVPVSWPHNLEEGVASYRCPNCGQEWRSGLPDGRSRCG